MRVLVRAVAALLVSLTVCAPALAQTPPDPAAQEPQGWLGSLTDPLVRMKAAPAGDGWVRPGEWSSIHVRLDNLGPAVEGDLVLRLRGDGLTEVEHRRRVELAAGTRRELSLPIKGPHRAGQFELQFQAGRRSVAGAIALRTLPEDDVLIGVIGQDAAGLQTVRAATGHAVPARDEVPYVHDDSDGAAVGPRAVRVGLLPIEALPEHGHGYQSFNQIVWIDADPTALSPTRAAALRHYVADGGHLVLTVTDRWRQVATGPLADMLPARPNGVADTDGATALARAVDQSAAGATAPQATLQIARAPGRAAAALVEGSEGPVWVMGTYGLGTVSVVAVDPRLRPLIPTVGAEPLWRLLTFLPATGEAAGRDRLRGADGLAVERNLGVSEAAGGGAFNRRRHDPEPVYGVALTEAEQGAMALLSDIPGVEPIPLTWLVGFAGLYLLLIGPLDYFLLRALRRELWTWVTFPVWIVLFSGIALAGITLLKGTQAVLTRVEVVDILPGTDLWRGDALYGVWSTQRARVKIGSGHPSGLGEPLEGHGMMTDPRYLHDAGGSEGSFFAQTWALAYARTSWTAQRPGTLRVEPMVGTPGEILVVNELPFDLLHVARCRGGGGELPVAIAAGARSRVPSAENRGGGDTSPTEAQASALRDACDWRSARRGGLAARDPYDMIVAYVGEPVEPYALGGLTPTRVNHTVIRVPVPVDPGLEARP
jgi:hypothetical protein